MAAPHETTIVLRDIGTQVGDAREPIIRGLEAPFIATADQYRDGSRPDVTTPNYTPLLIEDFSSGAVGAVYPSDKSYPSTSTARYDETVVFSGTKSAQVMVDIAGAQANPDFFGFRANLPASVGEGQTVWYAAKIYAPSNFSWGYGNGGDGVAELKFMRLSNASSGSRIYLQPHRQQNNINLISPPRMTLIAEAGPTSETFESTDAEFPRMEWFSACLAVRVASDATGFLRAWVNDKYIGEATGQTMPAATPINEWAIGTNWNGGPYDDGTATPYFYVGQVIIATDVSGYGAPNTLDSGGRPFIPSTVSVSDFA